MKGGRWKNIRLNWFMNEIFSKDDRPMICGKELKYRYFFDYLSLE